MFLHARYSTWIRPWDPASIWCGIPQPHQTAHNHTNTHVLNQPNILKTGKTVAAIYRPLNNPLLSSLLHRRQETYGGNIYRKGREAALGMVTALRKGQIMCLLVDQQLREGLAVPFFGHPARTSISHIKIAIKKQAPLFFMRTERLDRCRFRVTISPPLTLPQTADNEAVLEIATRINAEIEGWIRQKPEQWFWPHRRWGKSI